MTLPSEFLLHIAGLLERLGIPYHVGGSVASSAHGMYRASADIDFVIDPTRDQLDALAQALGSEFYVSRSAIDEAFSMRSTFNAIHDLTSFKIDFFIKGTAENTSSDRLDYFIDLVIEGADGTQLGTTTALAENVEPDQTAQWEAQTGTDFVEGATCRVVNIQRLPSL